MVGEAYIASIGVCLPNEPIGNDDVERILGQIGDRPSRSKAIVLKNNGISTRHYALDPDTGEMTHTNRELTAAAIRAMSEKSGFPIEAIECLACGTAGPDQLAPNHAVMVHGELGSPPCEVVSTTGVCCSGMTALKYGYLSVLSGQTTNAVVTASEVSSSGLRASNFIQSEEGQEERLVANPSVAFEADFLRWMLSDGAGAALITSEPVGALSLRIDWLDIFSFAGRYEPCMYSGCEKLEDGSLIGWRELGIELAVERGHFQVKQDVKLLTKVIAEVSLDSINRIKVNRGITADDFDWFLPHYSSEFFGRIMYDKMRDGDFDIPKERWFNNLASKGNTGSASIFIMLEELMESGRLSPGERVLCFVPESSRFTIAAMQLTVVPGPNARSQAC